MSRPIDLFEVLNCERSLGLPLIFRPGPFLTLCHGSNTGGQFLLLGASSIAPIPGDARCLRSVCTMTRQCIPGRIHSRATIGVGAQSTLGGHDIFAGKICIKNNKMPEVYMFLARKIITIPELLLYLSPKLTKNSLILRDFCPKNARILHKNCPKIFFPNFRGHVPPLPPVSYAYASN